MRPTDQAKSCKYGGGHFEVGKRGVSFIGTDKDGNAKPPTWICGLLEVIAKTRDNKSGEWGRLLTWRVISRVFIVGHAAGAAGRQRRRWRELARLGLHIGTSKAARDLLAAYVKVWPVEHRARCVDRLG